VGDPGGSSDLVGRDVPHPWVPPEGVPHHVREGGGAGREEDATRIRANLKAALGRGRDHDLPPSEYRIVRADGTERVLLGKARLSVGPDGQPLRMIGTVQDVTEGKKAEREHRIAETLQRSLLPERLPEIPGVLLAARYLPATSDLEVGGDWYDVVQLPNGSMGLAIGDVAGHGLRAASTMGQLRMALRAYALEEGSPSQVLGRVRRLVRVLVPDIVTLIYLVFDPESGTLRFANAGHPPPLLVEGNGQTSYLEGGLGPPLGRRLIPARTSTPPLTWTRVRPCSCSPMDSWSGAEASILDGLTRLKTLAADPGEDLEVLCDHLLDSMVTDEVSDDIALLALRQVPLAAGPLFLRLPAEPQVLAPLRQTVRRWLERSMPIPGSWTMSSSLVGKRSRTRSSTHTVRRMAFSR
jgi:Serine phosphatase RsbU, regulator of sigma subunit